MQHFRSNPPSRQIAPRPLDVPSYTPVAACLSAHEIDPQPCSGAGERGRAQLIRLEAFMVARDASPSALGRMVAKDPRLVFDLRNGTSPRDGLARKITAFFDTVEFKEKDLMRPLIGHPEGVEAVRATVGALQIHEAEAPS